jgi:capsule polysaccharide export protein KpsE/RkpR
MKRQLETATEAPPELQSHDSADSTPEVPIAPELFKANDVRLQAPGEVAVSVLGRQAVRTQTRGLPALRLLWAKRQITMYCTMAGCCAATLLAFAIPKQYVSVVKLMPPDAQATRSFGGFGSIAGDLLGVSTTGPLLVAMIRSRAVEDRMIDRFNLKQVYGVVLQQDAYKRLKTKTGFSVDGKNGIVVLSVTDNDPQRAETMARAYIEELSILMAQLNNSSAHRERVFLEDRLQIVKVEMETAEKDFSEFVSKNGAMDVAEQSRVMIKSVVKLQGEVIAERSHLEAMRQIYSDSNPLVRPLRARVSELVNQQKRLAGTHSGKAFVDGEASSSFPTLRQLPILGVPYESKFRKLKMEEAVYETLRAEFDSAKVQEARENPAVEVLDFPEVPERQSFPPRLLIIATGTGCAVILSGVWILGVARWREIDAQHAGMVLARELFGTVRWRTAVAAVNDAEQNEGSGKSDGRAGRPAKAQSA